MSTYIGKRVSYQCTGCGKQFTIDKKTVEEDYETLRNIYCSMECKATAFATEAIHIYPRHHEQIENLTWEQFIHQLRIAYRDGYLARVKDTKIKR